MNKKDLKTAFAKKGLKSAPVEIDGVGTVVVRELSVADLDLVDSDSTSDARAKNIALALYTEDGERIFDPNDQDDLDIIKGLGARTVSKLTQAFEEKN